MYLYLFRLSITRNSYTYHCRVANLGFRSYGIILTETRTELFLSRVSAMTRDIDIAILSVRAVLDEHGLTYRHSIFTIR